MANKRVYYMINEWRGQELQDLWVTDPAYQATASFGKNTGYYVGMDNIRSYYVTKHAADLGDGVGTMNAHPISTGLVELAGDGKTAKGLWYSIGQDTYPNGDGTAKALWNTGKVAIDFVRRGDAWKIWHIVGGQRHCLRGGHRPTATARSIWTMRPTRWRWSSAPPTIPMITHDATFNWWDNYPAPPPPMTPGATRSAMAPRAIPRRRNTTSAPVKEGTTDERA